MTAPMRIAITGATGLLGTALTAQLREEGHQVIPISRGAVPGGVRWDPRAERLDSRALEGIEAVVHLAGAGLADHRWTARRKREMWDSRVQGTSFLARTLAALERRPRVLLSMSAVGIYGDRGDAVLTEEAAHGTDYLARLVVAWERAAEPAREVGIRVVHPRTGVVLTHTGGALARMLIPFRLGLGGPLAGGRQWMSWITLDDAVAALRWLLLRSALAGAVNLTAPEPVTNSDFTAALGRLLGRPAIIPVPRAALLLLYGEMAEATLLASQRASSRRLVEDGFWFAYPDIITGLRRAVAG
jgi:uncharacterized protein (TIGR01777 family)